MLTVVLAVDVVDVWKGNRGTTVLRSIDKICTYPSFLDQISGILCLGLS
jgi:hypothetical protein